MLRLLAASVVLVLLIACANVASLLLARAVSRRRETAVRMAVGAGRSRLVRQWLTESVLLALLGASAACSSPVGAPLLHVAGIPETVDLVSECARARLHLCGAAAKRDPVRPGAGAADPATRHHYRAARRRRCGGDRRFAARLRSAFVVFQVALSLMLLVGAGLFLRTLRNAYAVDLGYGLDSTMVADINLDVRGYSQEAGLAAYQQILERLEATPGVAAAGAARVTVLSGGARDRARSASTDGRCSRTAATALDVRVNVVSDGYLDAMGIPVVRGRDFTAVDGPSVAARRHRQPVARRAAVARRRSDRQP